jgi:hypothetical protein
MRRSGTIASKKWTRVGFLFMPDMQNGKSLTCKKIRLQKMKNVIISRDSVTHSSSSKARVCKGRGYARARAMQGLGYARARPTNRFIFSQSIKMLEYSDNFQHNLHIHLREPSTVEILPSGRFERLRKWFSGRKKYAKFLISEPNSS